MWCSQVCIYYIKWITDRKKYALSAHLPHMGAKIAYTPREKANDKSKDNM